MTRAHLILCHARAVRSGFPHFAHAIAVIYFAEFGEAIPSGNTTRP